MLAADQRFRATDRWAALRTQPCGKLACARSRGCHMARARSGSRGVCVQKRAACRAQRRPDEVREQCCPRESSGVKADASKCNGRNSDSCVDEVTPVVPCCRRRRAVVCFRFSQYIWRPRGLGISHASDGNITHHRADRLLLPLLRWRLPREPRRKTHRRISTHVCGRESEADEANCAPGMAWDDG